MTAGNSMLVVEHGMSHHYQSPVLSDVLITALSCHVKHEICEFFSCEKLSNCVKFQVSDSDIRHEGSRDID